MRYFRIAPLELPPEDPGMVLSLREKASSEMCPHEGRGRADRASPSLCLALQSHQRHATERVFDSLETREVRALR
jgi:hypothetical protein